MIDIFDLILAVLFLILGVYAGVVFFRYRTKYHLTILIVIVLLLVSQVLDLLFPGRSSINRLFDVLGVGGAFRIPLLVTLLVLFLAFFYYPYVRWFFRKRKVKNLLKLVDAENDPDRKDGIYRDLLKQMPKSWELLYDYANFLWSVRKEYDRAEQCFLKAIELNPKSARVLSIYARFLMEIREDYDHAEVFTKKR